MRVNWQCIANCGASCWCSVVALVGLEWKIGENPDMCLLQFCPCFEISITLHVCGTGYVRSCNNIDLEDQCQVINVYYRQLALSISPAYAHMGPGTAAITLCWVVGLSSPESQH